MHTPRMPEAVENAIKDRVTRAEVSYEMGISPAVEEQDIVDLLNSVAQRLGAPEYALTNLSQVRSARMRLALSEPKFMGTGIARPGAAIGEKINSSMSPLQAVHLVARTGCKTPSHQRKSLNPKDVARVLQPLLVSCNSGS